MESRFIYKKGDAITEENFGSSPFAPSQETLDNLKIAREQSKKISEQNLENEMNRVLNQYDKSMFITICGSYRRGLPISSDIDILLCSLNISSINDIIVSDTNHLSEYVKYLHNKKFILDDITDKNIKTKYMGFCRLDNEHKIRRIDIRFIPMESYYYATLYFTGGKDLNTNMRLIAISRNYKLNEYGLYDENNKSFQVNSEKEIFELLDMHYIQPKLR